MGVPKYLVVAILSVAVAIPIESPELKTVEGNGEFAKNMYKVLSKEGGNVVFSPFSVHACLSMLYQGVSGPFVAEFAEVLKVPEPSTAAEGYKSIMEKLNNSPDITLIVANKAFVGRKIVPEFQSVVVEKFHSEIEEVDFGNLEKSANIVNSWVNDRTQGKIKELFEPVDFVDAIFTLVNTVYFKGAWEHQFSKRSTTSEPFFVGNEEQIHVDTMYLKGNFPYTESDQFNAQILEMAYSNKNFSMVFVLPREKDGIKGLEAKIIGSDFNEIMQNMEVEEVVVSLPKFKFEKSIELEPVLTEMGLGSIFIASPYIDKVVTPTDNVLISRAIQKVVIQVDEEGSEAAAATGVIGVERSLKIGPPPKVFNANHPFLFFLIHKSSEGPTSYRNILFYGKVERPMFN